MSETNPEAPRKVILFSGHMIDAPGTQDAPVSAGQGADRSERHRGGARRARRRASRPLHLRRRLRRRSSVRRSRARAFRPARALYSVRRGRRFLKNRSTSPAMTGAPGSSPRRRARSCTFCPSSLGPSPKGEDPYERNNRWMLDVRKRLGPDKVDFVCLWNGEGGDGPGGTRHMMEEVAEAGGRTHVLETTNLWG